MAEENKNINPEAVEDTATEAKGKKSKKSDKKMRIFLKFFGTEEYPLIYFLIKFYYIAL